MPQDLSHQRRRRFLQSVALTPLAAHAAVRGADASLGPPRDRGGFALDANRARFFSSSLHTEFKVMMIADTHLFRDDDRGLPFEKYSGRMAKAYNQTRHFKTGEPTNPEMAFVETLKIAKEAGVKWVLLAGDIVSFPSEAAVEWVMEKMDASGLPHAFVAGNHDWHYEGMEGTLEELRQTWIRERLLPLYSGANPLMQVQEVEGVRIVLLDNSHYEILPEQLAFYRKQVEMGQPMLLVVHIPLYAPGRSVGYGCGHPQWNATTDRNYPLERRPQWPKSGHTETTLTFHREVFATPNLLGICAGHIHRPTLDIIEGIPQIVTEANATGGYLMTEFVPLS